MEVDKVRENRLRRMAHRQGYAVVKSRIRDPLAIGFGTYGIVKPNPTADAWRDVPVARWPTAALPELVAGDRRRGFGLTLDAVETWLAGGNR